MMVVRWTQLNWHHYNGRYLVASDKNGNSLGSVASIERICAYISHGAWKSRASART